MINGLSINPDVLVEHRSTFVARLNFMFGDADSYSLKEIPCSEAEVILIKNLYEHGKWDRDWGYSRDPLYKELAETFDEDDMCDYFPCDHDAWGYAKFNALEVVWYDEHGLPHAVEFWWR